MTSTLVSTLAFGQIILVQYVESILFTFGVIGSILNIILFSQRKLRLNSCCIYFLASSIAALILLIIGIIPQLYSLNHSPNAIFNGNFCKIRGYLSQLSAMLCRWLLTIACIDRCLLTSTNVRLRLFSTVHLARKIILLFYILWLIIPIHMLIYTDVRRIGYIVCMMSTDIAAIYHSIYTIIVGGLFPPLIMLICTKILWKSLEMKRQRHELNQRENKREIRDIQILIMLLLQVIIYILFTLPYMSFNLYITFTRSIINKSNDRLAIESFMQLFTEMTIFIYPATTFYSNTLISKTFRNELIILFWKIITCGREQRSYNRQRIGPTTFAPTINRRNVLPMVVVN